MDQARSCGRQTGTDRRNRADRNSSEPMIALCQWIGCIWSRGIPAGRDTRALLFRSEAVRAVRLHWLTHPHLQKFAASECGSSGFRLRPARRKHSHAPQRPVAIQDRLRVLGLFCLRPTITQGCPHCEPPLRSIWPHVPAHPCRPGRQASLPSPPRHLRPPERQQSDRPQDRSHTPGAR